jgi:hypothetical protein
MASIGGFEIWQRDVNASDFSLSDLNNLTFNGYRIVNIGTTTIPGASTDIIAIGSVQCGYPGPCVVIGSDPSYDTIALGSYAVAIGAQIVISALCSYDTAIGAQIDISDYSSYGTAVGHNININPYAYSSVAIGDTITVGNHCYYNVAIGSSINLLQDNNNIGTSNVAIGYYIQSHGHDDVLIGSLVGQTNIGSQLIAINGPAVGNNTINIGGTVAAGDNTIAIGKGASTDNRYTDQIAIRGTVSGNNSIAIGISSTTFADNTIAIGISSTTFADNTIAIGNNAQAGGNIAIAIGLNAYASINAIAIGPGTSSYDNSIAIGMSATVNSSYNSIAIGNGATIASFTGSPVFDAIAIGTNATVNGFTNSIAIGSNATATMLNQCVIGSSTLDEFQICMSWIGNLGEVAFRVYQPLTKGSVGLSIPICDSISANIYSLQVFSKDFTTLAAGDHVLYTH